MGSTFLYNSYTRLEKNKIPIFDCANINDKFTISTSSENGKLKYPIALMTADEVSFAGGVYGKNASTYYYYNSAKGSSTGNKGWWTTTPSKLEDSLSYVFFVFGSNNPGKLTETTVFNTYLVARPVTSLKSCVKWSSGDGTANSPYTIDESYSC